MFYSNDELPIDSFYAAAGFEIISDTPDEAEQFAKNVIDLEQKKYFVNQG